MYNLRGALRSGLSLGRHTSLQPLKVIFIVCFRLLFIFLRCRCFRNLYCFICRVNLFKVHLWCVSCLFFQVYLIVGKFRCARCFYLDLLLLYWSSLLFFYWSSLLFFWLCYVDNFWDGILCLRKLFCLLLREHLNVARGLGRLVLRNHAWYTCTLGDANILRIHRIEVGEDLRLAASPR